jgi:hypothetical protein
MTDTFDDVIALWRQNRTALSAALDAGTVIPPASIASARATVAAVRTVSSSLPWTETQRATLVAELDAADAVLDRAVTHD